MDFSIAAEKFAEVFIDWLVPVSLTLLALFLIPWIDRHIGGWIENHHKAVVSDFENKSGVAIGMLKVIADVQTGILHTIGSLGPLIVVVVIIALPPYFVSKLFNLKFDIAATLFSMAITLIGALVAPTFKKYLKAPHNK